MGVPVGIGGWDKAVSGGKEIWRGRYERSTGSIGCRGRRVLSKGSAAEFRARDVTWGQD